MADGARVLVTGASRGIGAALARVAASEGRDLVLTARDAGDLERLSRELAGRFGVSARVIAADIAIPEEVDRVWAEAGPVDVLVNNAGLGGAGDFARPETWPRERQMLEVNLLAATRLAKLATGAMISAGAGRILNVASLAGYLPGPNMAIYFATKVYLRALSDALWQETRGRGVSVTALCPGPVDTAFFEAGGLRGGRRMLPAEAVARAGWRGMMAGRRTVIPGARNRAIAALTSCLPRAVLLPVTARILNHRR